MDCKKIVDFWVERKKDIILGIHFLVFSTILFFYTGPAVREGIENRRQYQETLRKMEQVRLFASRYQEEQEILLRQQVSHLKKMVPESLSEATCLKTIHRAAEQSHLTILSVIPGKVIPQKTFQEQSFRITVKGNFYQLLLFMRRINHCPEHFFFEKSSLKAANSENFLIFETSIVSFATQFIK
jgi:Tfp pilus assembly protein PilO